MNFLSKRKQNLLSLSRSDIRSLSVNKTLSLRDQALTPTRFQVTVSNQLGHLTAKHKTSANGAQGSL